MAFDYSTAVGRTRLLVSDVDVDRLVLDDDAYVALLDLCGSDVRLAAAQALDTIASSEALLSKKLRTQDLSTDGPAVAAQLRAHAAQLRAQVAAGASTGSTSGTYGVPVWDFPDAALVPRGLGWD